MKYELHCHSIHSKGSKIYWEGIMAPRQIPRALKRMGFGGFALTDHDTVAGLKEAELESRKLGMVFIPGIEIFTASGHLIGLGVRKPLKKGMPLGRALDAIHAEGGIAVAPHPFDLRGEGVGDESSRADAIEAFNSLNLTRFENYVACKYARRLGMPIVGGSDAHSPEMLGRTINHIEAHDADSAIEQIVKGKVDVEGRYIRIPDVVSWARERMRLSERQILSYIDMNYSAPKAWISRILMRKFIRSGSSAWLAPAYLAVGSAVLYSAARIAADEA